MLLALLPSAHSAGPALLSPEDGATTGPQVEFGLQLAEEGAQVRIEVRELVEDDVPFSLVLLPDTQFYTVDENVEANGDLFSEQTAWIVGAIEEYNIAFVSHLGDIVQNWDNTTEWERADGALSLLDGEVPYGFVLGNHDYDAPGQALPEEGLIGDYFPVSRYADAEWWGGSYPEGTPANSYQLFTASNIDFLILHIEFQPRSEVVAWAAEVIAAYPDRFAIISTHRYLTAEGEPWGDNTQQWIFEQLVEPFPSVLFVLSAHVDGDACRTDELEDGRLFHQLLSCYQGMTAGGEGWLRLLELYPQDNLVNVSAYSPYLSEWSGVQYALDVPLRPFFTAAEVTGSSEESVLVTWQAPERDSSYEWRVAVISEDAETGEETVTESEALRFTVDATPPQITALQVRALGADQAEVTVQTDEESLATVRHGPSESELVSVTSAALAVEHSLVLEGLVPGQPWRIEVTVEDVYGNASAPEVESLTLEGEVGDSGDVIAAADTGEARSPAATGCGCGGGAGGGGGLLLPLLLLWGRRR